IYTDDFGYIEVSTDGGSSWEQLGEEISGAQDSFVEETRSLGDYLGEEDVRIRFRLTSDIFDNQDGWYIDDVTIILNPTGVEEESEGQIPLAFSLSQNYPNPFNSSTEIVFSIPEESQVSLTIYNLLGQTVIRPLEEKLPAGEHNFLWAGKDSEGKELPSGLYFYRLSTGEFSDTRKMTILK
ncbi:MAG: T9SS type A sorting domain-containing protein, partial [Candidatus Zixiibacteriota bacterium]